MYAIRSYYGGRVDLQLLVLPLAALQGQQAVVVDVRLVLLQLLEEAAGAEQEDASYNFV